MLPAELAREADSRATVYHAPGVRSRPTEAGRANGGARRSREDRRVERGGGIQCSAGLTHGASGRGRLSRQAHCDRVGGVKTDPCQSLSDQRQDPGVAAIIFGPEEVPKGKAITQNTIVATVQQRADVNWTSAFKRTCLPR